MQLAQITFGRPNLIHADPRVSGTTISHNAVVARQRQHQASRVAMAIDCSDGRDWGGASAILAHNG